MLELGKFRKSSFSGATCVEVALLPAGGVAVRNSRHPDRPPHVFTPAEWRAFLLGMKAGEFDLPES